jgi:heme-degrading monooxygenase HmoA
MAEFYSSGVWIPNEGDEDDFVAAWTDFAGWACSMPGATGEARLLHDLRQPGRYLSILSWESMEAIKEWKGSPDWGERMGPVQAHVDKFEPTEMEVVAVGKP